MGEKPDFVYEGGEYYRVETPKNTCLFTLNKERFECGLFRHSGDTLERVCQLDEVTNVCIAGLNHVFLPKEGIPRYIAIKMGVACPKSTP